MTDNEDIEEIKQEKAAKIVYIALTAVIVLTMIISVVSAVNRRNRAKTPPAEVTESDGTSAPDQGMLPQITVPADTSRQQPGPQETKPAQTEPAHTEPAQSAAEPQEQDEPASAERIFVVPVNGSVIKDYTMDMPAYSVTMNDYRVHNGMDLRAYPGDPVCAFADGVVAQIYFDPMMGQTVVIDHGKGLQSVYQNLQVTLPDKTEVGAAVSAGDVIAAVGETSLIECAEVTHLHFSLKKDGAFVSPSDYLGPVYATEE
ncbi:MAG: peptidoglycan DD-metalloendopeptidase family protein [Clostridia bacterium]|nr:peptidoglycan DD-metalloendopeptidase family protein [Clostridia bacterium]